MDPGAHDTLLTNGARFLGLKRLAPSSFEAAIRGEMKSGVAPAEVSLMPPPLPLLPRLLAIVLMSSAGVVVVLFLTASQLLG